MNTEAGNARILALLLGEGKEFSRLDPILQKRLIEVFGYVIAANSLADLRFFKRLDLKFYNGYWQVRVDGDKRLWFQEGPNGLVIHEFDEGNH